MTTSWKICLLFGQHTDDNMSRKLLNEYHSLIKIIDQYFYRESKNKAKCKHQHNPEAFLIAAINHTVKRFVTF